MHIVVISRAWPSSEHSGVSLAAAAHVEMLVELGHAVSIIGSTESVLRENLPVARRFYVPASGSGALYAPAKVDQHRLLNAMVEVRPELVVIEAWQTALTDAAIDVAFNLRIPVLMISHGVSLHSFSNRWSDKIRALGWMMYRYHRLPRLISRVSAITVLSEYAASSRFHDRNVAYRLGIPTTVLGNFPVHWNDTRPAHSQRKRQVVVIGYFSAVKNQLNALEVLRQLPGDVSMLFIGQRKGKYYDRCVKRAKDLGLLNRIYFYEDHECDISEEVSRSQVVLSTSITEALPICLLEAMACGTPFVATPVGAVPSLEVGLIHADCTSQAKAVLNLLDDPLYWESCSIRGIVQFEKRFSKSRIREQLAAAVELACRKLMLPD